ncbi:MAG: O-antigen ligase family protein [Phycisphaerae bacterium]
MSKAAKSALVSFYFFVLLFGATVQDLPSFFLFGEIGRSPIFLLLPVFLLVEFYLLFKNRTIRLKGKIEPCALFIAVWLLFISLAYMLYFLIIDRPVVLYNDTLLSKGIKISVYWVVILLFVRQLRFCAEYLGIVTAWNTVTLCYWAIVFFFLMELVRPALLVPLHATQYYSGGIRLLTSECSWAGSVYILFYILSLYYLYSISASKHKTIRFILLSIPTGLFLFYSHSKGMLFALALTSLCFALRYFATRRIRVRNLVLMALLLLFLIPYPVYRATKSLKNDIAQYTSTSTRLTSNIASIVICLNHPLGVGSAYLWYFPEALRETAQTVLDINPNFNMREIYNTLKDDIGLSPKSGFCSVIMFGGFPVLIGLSILWIRLYRKARKSNLFVFGLLFGLISVLTYLNLEIKYELWVFICLIDCLAFSSGAEHRTVTKHHVHRGVSDIYSN